MLPTSRSITQIEDARTNADGANRISAAAKTDSSPAFVGTGCLATRFVGT